MNDLALSGPDALTLLSALGVNSFEGFAGGRAKHFVPCSPGRLRDRRRHPLRARRRPLQPRRPRAGPELGHVPRRDRRLRRRRRARPAQRAAHGRPPALVPVPGARPERDAGDREGARRPGPGAEVLPPDLRDDRRQDRSARCGTGWPASPAGSSSARGRTSRPVREAIVEAGEEFGLRQVGGRAYSANTLESGWIPSPLPAVYTGAELEAYREWLPATGYEGSASIGGSFVSDDIEDWYFTPWDLGYGNYVKFDHDFVGRDALERMAEDEHRVKVTLALDDDDVAETIGTMFRKEGRAKFMDWPSAVYSMHPYDAVLADGEPAGVSTWIGYSANEGKMLTLAVARPGARRARHRGDARLGRAGRRHGEADCRAARAGRDPRDREPGPVQRGREEGIPCLRLSACW